jgi:hypothetical protein
MDLYLYGHGFMLKAGPKSREAGLQPHGGFKFTPVDFVVPTDFTIRFYVDEGVLFDSLTEPIIFGQQQPSTSSQFRNALLSKPLDVTGGSSCDNLILTRPGRMETLTDPSAVKEIEVDRNDPHICQIVGDVHDKTFFAIKKGGKPGAGRSIPSGETNLPVYTYLSSISTALKQKIPTEKNVVLHWVCCRATDLLLDEDGGSFTDAMEQARDVWKKLPDSLTSGVRS